MSSDNKINMFVGGGKMGEVVRTKDWSKTPLGPIEQWPQSLKTTVSLCLSSNFPIAIAWGPQRVQIYNDGYWPICGDKHPASMGQDFKECWEEPWPVIGDAFESATNGQTKFLTNQRMFLNRFGYMEETFFTFTFSPIIDEKNEVGGLFHPVTELTQQSLGERRLDLLRNIGNRVLRVKTIKETITQLMDVFNESTLDIPFAQIYLLNADGGYATLAASSGIPAEIATKLSPEKIDVANASAAIWPLASALESGKPVLVDDLSKLFGAFECGPYPEPPKSAFVFPIVLPNLTNLYGFVIVGVSARRALDESYRTFYDLLITAITNALSLAKANEEEEKRIEGLLELDKAKTAFFSNISHEFRTPLMLMLGPIDSLLSTETGLNKDQKEQMRMLQRNALRLQRLVNSLLDFSSIEAGRIKASFSATDLSSFTQDLASVFESAVQSAGLEYAVRCGALSQLVYIDHEMWEKIVLNLLSNALKFTFSGSIQISLSEDKNGAILTVTDTGEGINKEGLESLFSRFYRVQGAKSRTHEGSGIGLSLINELAKLHGGGISVTSEPGKGSTFTVNIPFGKEHLPSDKVVLKATGQKISGKVSAFLNETEEWVDKNAITEIVLQPGANEHGDRSLILLVDDNADILEYISRVLIQNPNWELAKARNGVEALAFMKGRKPSLILSDIMMPEMDGLELLKRVRADEATKRLPVILLSARAGEDSSIEAREMGADDYLVKPFSANELYARVKGILAMAEIRSDNNDLVRLLHQKNKEMEQMAFIASHDLQQPLNTNVSFLQMLVSEYGAEMNEDAQTLIKYALEATDSMREIITSLLDYSRLGKEEELELVDCNQLLQTIKADAYALLKEKNAEVEIGELPVLYGFRTKLKLLFQNLISNSIKFQPPGAKPKVIISAKSDGRYWEFAVEDNGIGIEEKSFTKIFQIFQRLHARDTYEGTGIGLAHCKKIVELHYGTISLQSKINEGTTFFFTIKNNIDKQFHKETNA